MKRLRIQHQTDYAFTGWVELYPHTLRLRPREGHELRIESSVLTIVPEATLRWHRDSEGNSVAIATFTGTTRHLSIHSEIIIQQYDQAPHDFLVADYAVDYPFQYSEQERLVLSPYMENTSSTYDELTLAECQKLWQPGENIQTFALLLRLNQYVYLSLNYRKREEEGVQSAEQTLRDRSGSCRDFACLFMTLARKLGLASRFVSGYLYDQNSNAGDTGSTHAWAEVFIPGAGWKGFDPTTGAIAGANHIAVAVSVLPESVPPVAGSFRGTPGTTMTVDVRVSALN